MCGAVAWGVALVAAGGRRGEDSARDRPRARCSPPRDGRPRRPRRRPSSSPSGASASSRAWRASTGDEVRRRRRRRPRRSHVRVRGVRRLRAETFQEFGDDRESSRDARAGGAANVWFGVEPGEIVCVVGSRDSGKETLARCAAGMDPFAGDALFADGAASARTGWRRRAHRRGRGRVPSRRRLRRRGGDAGGAPGARRVSRRETPPRVARDVAASAGLFENLEGVEGDRTGHRTANRLRLAETPLCALDLRRDGVALASRRWAATQRLLIFDAPTRAVDSSARRRVWRRLVTRASRRRPCWRRRTRWTRRRRSRPTSSRMAERGRVIGRRQPEEDSGARRAARAPGTTQR